MTLGARVTPRRSIATAPPFGGGSFASSELIKTAAETEANAVMQGNRNPINNNAREINDPSRSKSTTLSTRSAVTDYGIRRPEQWMGIGELGLAVSADIAGTIDQRHHRLPQTLAA